MRQISRPLAFLLVLLAPLFFRSLQGADPPGGVVRLAGETVRSLYRSDKQTTYTPDINDQWTCQSGQVVPGAINGDDCNGNNVGQFCYTCANDQSFEGYVTNYPSQDGALEQNYDCGKLSGGTCEASFGQWYCDATPKLSNCSEVVESLYQNQPGGG
jgi:hypothetical protein